MFIGIDVASDRCDVAVGSQGAVCTYISDDAGLDRLEVDWRQVDTVELVMLEATGGYEALAVAPG
jgi:transposase